MHPLMPAWRGRCRPHIEFVKLPPDSPQLPALEVGDPDAAPALSGADHGAEHELDHRLLAKRVGDDLEAPSFLEEAALQDVEKAERLLRNMARRLDQEAPVAAASILEGLNEILTVIQLGPSMELRRSLACTKIIENMLGTVLQVTRDVKRWRCAGPPSA